MQHLQHPLKGVIQVLLVLLVSLVQVDLLVKLAAEVK